MKYLLLFLLKALAVFFAMAATTYAASPSLAAAALSGAGSVAAYLIRSPLGK